MTTPILWTAAWAEAATGGRSSRPWQATGLCIDSRQVRPGDLFIALQGPRFDGHAFVGSALAQGAAAAMVHRPQGLGADSPILEVADTRRALEDLARAARSRSQAGIVAVTGSVGKTGTKEMLRAMLEAQGPTAATQGNLNNDLGVPLSLARLPRDTAYGVFEIGMNHAGEIGPLSALVRPEVSLITTVDAAHLEYFPSVEAIADAKAEIFEGQAPGAVAVLNLDNPHFERLAAKARARGLGVLTFGAHPKADARLIDCAVADGSTRVAADFLGRALTYAVGAAGRHWAMNSLAALLAVHALNASVELAAASLETLHAPQGRGRVHRVEMAKGAFELADDSYNANPASMRAAIETLGATRPGPGGRRIAILGDMLELGPGSAVLHAGLAHLLQEAQVDIVYTAGRQMGHLRDALPAAMRGGHAADASALAPLIDCVPRPGDVVLVKGSAGSKMGLIVDALLKLDIRGGALRRVANGG